MKGYRCAHNALYNESSCSYYCKNQIESKGLIKGIKNTIERFKECKQAAMIIKDKRKAMKERANNSFSGVRDECKGMNTCDKLFLAEAFGEAACCIFSSIS